MGREDEIMRAIGNLEGTVMQGFKGLEGHISGVSAKTDKIELKIDNHISTDQAHGSMAERRGVSGVIAIVSAFAACLGLIAALAKLGLLKAVVQ